VRAVAIDAFGQPPTLRELPMPEPGSGEVRIRLRAAGVNPIDWRVRDGAPAQFGQTARFPLILGLEGAGVIDKAGDQARLFAPGDEVLGLFWPEVFQHGTFADYLVVSDDARMAHKPAEISFQQAAALPLAGGAAVAGLNALELAAGDTLLVVGASGGVGIYACQLAKRRHIRVVATTRNVETNAEYLKRHGADMVIDVSDLDGPTSAELGSHDVDAVLDLVSDPNRLAQIAAAIRPGGRIVSLIAAADPDRLTGLDIRAQNLISHPQPDDFAELAGLAATGKLHIPLAHTYPLEQAPEALGLSEAGAARGKIVLEIA
jgi:NADPH:quinone reductase-like Zn-dependent oxidoreductase